MKPDKAMNIALDAAAFGKSKAAKKNKVSERSVERANATVAADPVLAETVAQKKRRMAEELHDKRVDVISALLDGMKDRLKVMEDREFIGAYKILTDHHEVALRVMDDGRRSETRGQGIVDSATPSEGRVDPPVSKREWPMFEYAQRRTQ